MRVKFLGVENVIKESGCTSCGTKTYSTELQTEKTYILMSGLRLEAELNKEYDVSEADGNFLLSQGDFEQV